MSAPSPNVRVSRLEPCLLATLFAVVTGLLALAPSQAAAEEKSAEAVKGQLTGRVSKMLADKHIKLTDDAKAVLNEAVQKGVEQLKSDGLTDEKVKEAQSTFDKLGSALIKHSDDNGELDAKGVQNAILDICPCYPCPFCP